MKITLVEIKQCVQKKRPTDNTDHNTIKLNSAFLLNLAQKYVQL